MARTRYVRVPSDTARSRGIDWTSRGLYFSDSPATIALLKEVISDLEKKQEDKSAAR